jgi:hypothetical protein
LKLARQVLDFEQQQLQALGQWQILSHDSAAPVRQSSVFGDIEQVDQLLFGDVLHTRELLLSEIKPGGALE